MSSPKTLPPVSDSPIATPAKRVKPLSTTMEDHHDLECRIQRALQAHPDLKFARLIVHQCPQGVCLEGLLESNERQIDLCTLVNDIADVKVINRVVTQRPINLPR